MDKIIDCRLVCLRASSAKPDSVIVSNCHSRSDAIYYESQFTLYIHLCTCLQRFIVGFPVGLRNLTFLQNFVSVDLLIRNYNVKKHKSPIRRP